jgi:hypothetical protein
LFDTRSDPLQRSFQKKKIQDRRCVAQQIRSLEYIKKNRADPIALRAWGQTESVLPRDPPGIGIACPVCLDRPAPCASIAQDRPAPRSVSPRAGIPASQRGPAHLLKRSIARTFLVARPQTLSGVERDSLDRQPHRYRLGLYRIFADFGVTDQEA